RFVFFTCSSSLYIYILSLHDALPISFPHLYYGLYALQHRGQAAVGIGTITPDGNSQLIREKGLISEHFGDGLIEHMPGNKGIGFVQYRFENRESEPMPL